MKRNVEGGIKNGVWQKGFRSRLKRRTEGKKIWKKKELDMQPTNNKEKKKGIREEKKHPRDKDANTTE